MGIIACNWEKTEARRPVKKLKRLSRWKKSMAWGHSYSSEGGKKQLDPECIVKKVQTKIAGISNMGVIEVKMSPRVLAWPVKEWSWQQPI